MQGQKRRTEEELAAIRERNREDLSEIDRLTLACEQADRAGDELSGELRNLEFEISKTLNRVEELNREIDQKSFDLKGKEQQLDDCEREINTLKNQLNSFVSELTHLKGLEQRYKEENYEI